MTAPGRSMGVIALGLLFLLPSAAAVASEGSLTLQGPIRFAAGADLSLRPVAVVGNAAEGLTVFRAEDPAAEVCVHERQFVEATAGGSVRIPSENPRVRCWPKAPVALELLDDGNHSGYFGIYAQPGTTLNANGIPAAEGKTASVLAGEGNRDSGNANEDDAA